MSRNPITWKNMSGAGLSQSLNTAIAANRTLQQSVNGIGKAFDDWGQQREDEFTADTMAQLSAADSAERDALIAKLSAPGQTRRFDATKIMGLDRELDQADLQNEKFEFQKDSREEDVAWRQKQAETANNHWQKTYQAQMARDALSRQKSLLDITAKRMSMDQVRYDSEVQAEQDLARREGRAPDYSRIAPVRVPAGGGGGGGIPAMAAPNVSVGSGAGMAGAVPAAGGAPAPAEVAAEMVQGAQGQAPVVGGPEGQSGVQMSEADQIRQERLNRILDPGMDPKEFKDILNYEMSMTAEEANKAAAEAEAYNTPEAQLLFKSLSALPVTPEQRDRMFTKALEMQNAGQEQPQGAVPVQADAAAPPVPDIPKVDAQYKLRQASPEHQMEAQKVRNFYNASLDTKRHSKEDRQQYYDDMTGGLANIARSVLSPELIADANADLNSLLGGKVEDMTDKELMENGTRIANLTSKDTGHNAGGISERFKAIDKVFMQIQQEFFPNMAPKKWDKIKEDISNSFNIPDLKKNFDALKRRQGEIQSARNKRRNTLADKATAAKVDYVNNTEKAAEKAKVYALKTEYPKLNSTLQELRSTLYDYAPELKSLSGENAPLDDAIWANIERKLLSQVEDPWLRWPRFRDGEGKPLDRAGAQMYIMDLYNKEANKINQQTGGTVFKDTIPVSTIRKKREQELKNTLQAIEKEKENQIDYLRTSNPIYLGM